MATKTNKPKTDGLSEAKRAYIAASRRQVLADLISALSKVIRNYAFDGGSFYAAACDMSATAVAELRNAAPDADAEGGAE